MERKKDQAYHKVREEKAAAGFEVGGAVGGADEEAGECAAGGLGEEVEDCAGKGGEAGEEGGEGYGWVEVGACYGGLGEGKGEGLVFGCVVCFCGY